MADGPFESFKPGEAAASARGRTWQAENKHKVAKMAREGKGLESMSRSTLRRGHPFRGMASIVTAIPEGCRRLASLPEPWLRLHLGRAPGLPSQDRSAGLPRRLGHVD